MMDEYNKKHESFKNYLKMLEKSIDDPSTREICIK